MKVHRDFTKASDLLIHAPMSSSLELALYKSLIYYYYYYQAEISLDNSEWKKGPGNAGH